MIEKNNPANLIILSVVDYFTPRISRNYVQRFIIYDMLYRAKGNSYRYRNVKGKTYDFILDVLNQKRQDSLGDSLLRDDFLHLDEITMNELLDHVEVLITKILAAHFPEGYLAKDIMREHREQRS